MLHCTEEESSSTARGTPSLRPQRTRRLWIVAFAAFLILAYGKPLFELVLYASGADLHSHILLIPFISAYLIYLRRGELPNFYESSPKLALIPALIGLASLLAAWNSSATAALSQNDYLSLTAFSFVCLLVAGGFVFLGRRGMGIIAFPIAFLLFIIPLPDQARDWLETASKFASADAAALFFNIAGTPVLRDGVIFQLPGIVIEVAQECSGIRSSWVLFITTLAASYLFLKSPWRRTILIAFVIPLAILRNGFRIWVIGTLCVEMGPQMIYSFVHHRGGPIFFILSLFPLFLLLWWLRKGELSYADPNPREDMRPFTEFRDSSPHA